MSGWEPNSDSYSFSMPQHFCKAEQTYYTKLRAQKYKYQYYNNTKQSKTKTQPNYFTNMQEPNNAVSLPGKILYNCNLYLSVFKMNYQSFIFSLCAFMAKNKMEL